MSEAQQAQMPGSPRCSFCGKRPTDPKAIISGPAGVAICSACVQLAVEILEEQHAPPDQPRA